MYGLHDHPSGRSSHWKPTVTGMGLIVALALIAYLFWRPDTLPKYFVTGFFIITAVSFMDDIFSQNIHYGSLCRQLLCACCWCRKYPPVALIREIYPFIRYPLFLELGFWMPTILWMVLTACSRCMRCWYLVVCIIWMKILWICRGIPSHLPIPTLFWALLFPWQYSVFSIFADLPLLLWVMWADAALTVCYKLLLGENIFLPHRVFCLKN